MQTNPKKIKAVGLMSGGLDSTLATKLMCDQGFDVLALHFVMPWGEAHLEHTERLAQRLGFQLQKLQLGDDYLAMLQRPRYGYGKAFNPCLDCHIFMLNKAVEVMEQVGAEFIFTGEVLGQRPMSQRRDCFSSIAKQTPLAGRLLRPLCAQLLEPTIPEQEGIVDRSQLLAISGKSRRVQLALAESWGLKEYFPPGGGCALTYQPFGNKMKDFLDFGCRDSRETAILKWGRYFRISPQAMALVGRNERDNASLRRLAWAGDYLLEPVDFAGPTVVVKVKAAGGSLLEAALELAAGLLQYHSKEAAATPREVFCWSSGREQDRQVIKARPLTKEIVQSLQR